jgi:membrane protein implicated in regulation of membrane protease activity
MEEAKLLQGRYSKVRSFFNIARFDPDSWFSYGLLAVIAIALYALGFAYFAIVPATAICCIFLVEAFEVIHLDHPVEKQIVGAKCLVLRRISKIERGVVGFTSENGHPSWELWSAESAYSLEEGNTVLVSGIKGITLQVEPLSVH